MKKRTIKYTVAVPFFSNDYKFSTLCLYRDFTKSKHDYSIRSFPTLYDFLCSFLLGVNKSKIKKENP